MLLRVCLRKRRAAETAFACQGSAFTRWCTLSSNFSDFDDQLGHLETGSASVTTAANEQDSGADVAAANFVLPFSVLRPFSSIITVAGVDRYCYWSCSTRGPIS